MRKCLLLLSLCLFIIKSNAQICDSLAAQIVYDFEVCSAGLGIDNSDYSELIPDFDSVSVCSNINSSNIYRINPTVNTHSCAPGREEGTALCISPLDNCSYLADSEKALRFDITVSPGLSGVAQLNHIEFYQQAPLIFRFLNGAQGLNKYPRKYGIRILKDGEQIFLNEDINTSTIWSKQTFDFTDSLSFRVFEETLFEVELLPYCPTNNSYAISVWDIDDLIINSCCIECPDLEGGELSSEVSELCIGDGTSNLVNTTLSGASGPLSVYAITNSAGLVTDFPVYPPFDFSNADSGICSIWHLSYEGEINVEIGAHLNAASGCFNLSNAVEIDKNKVEGGDLSTSTGEDILVICNGNGEPALADLILEGSEGDNSKLVITDLLGNVQELPQTEPIDFEGSSYGTCYIWNLSYSDDSENLEVGDNINELSGCFDLSNPITVIRNGVKGGVVTLHGETEACILPEDMDNVMVQVDDLVGQRDTWLVTDLNNNILKIPIIPPFDLSDLPNGQFRIYHVAHTSDFTGAVLGNNVSDLDGCYDVSSPLTLTKLNLNSGTISTDDNTTTCTGDGVSDVINFSVSNNSSSFSSWIVTDALGEILVTQSGSTFDFEGAGAGKCFVYFIAYESGIENLDVGAFITEIRGCFEISNGIEVNRIEVDGGSISTEDPTNICAGDGIDDFIDVELSANIGSNSTWVITDENGNILDLPTAPPFNFENAGDGICLIWHLSYEDDLQGAVIGQNASGLIGCFNLSNPIQVNRTGVNGGEIISSSELNVCVGDGNNDLVDVEVSGNQGSNSAWVITDTNGVILDLPSSPPFNFESTSQGTCIIWHLSFESGLEGAEVGQNANNLRGCFSLSNPIYVNREEVRGGTISTQDPTDICSGDGFPDLVELDVVNRFGQRLRWVLTDNNGVILDIKLDGSFDFEGAGSGTCFIYHISYNAGIIGLISNRNISDLEGCFDLSNRIEINRSSIDGGDVSTNDDLEICFPEGTSPTISASVNGAQGSNSAWLLTNESGQIIANNSSGLFNLAMTGSGTSFIWHISYENGLTGANPGSNASDIQGCFDLSNSIEFNPRWVDGGEISTEDPTSICVGNNVDDIVTVELESNFGPNSKWVITDLAANILDLSDSNVFNFEGAGFGTCLIWHLSYDGSISGLSVGENATNLSGCFDLSNSITIEREEVDGGIISTIDVTAVCVGDGFDDIINADLSGAVGINRIWLVTDQDFNILDIVTNGVFNFEGAGGGICLIWHLSFDTGLTGLAFGGNVSDFVGCYDLSNSIIVNRTEINGGTISTSDNTNTCSGDGVDDLINVQVNNRSGTNGTYLVTDAGGLILDRQNSSIFNFEGAPSGVCFIWHLSYESGTSGIGIGDNISNATGCFNLSNAITVNRNFVSGGVISTLDNLTVCSGDGMDDLINVNLNQEEGALSSWVITDESLNILDIASSGSFNFEGAGAGICLIWHLSYEPGLTGLIVGQNASGLAGCFNLSNPIQVNRSEVNGGVVSTSDNLDLCVGDGTSDLIEVNLSSQSGSNSRFIVTDELGNILALQSSPIFDFEGAGPGICLIWHISYDSGITGLNLSGNVSDLSGCFHISNSLSVNRFEAFAGTISTNDNTSVCVLDGFADLITPILSNSNAESTDWVITDENGVILDIPQAPPFDFDGAGPGTCFIWNIAHSGIISGLAVGENVSGISGCFEFSNSIEVTRAVVGGGNITLTTGGTFINICVGDCIIDSLSVVLTGNSGTNSEWIVTDDAANILVYPANPPFIFESAPAGTCHIWHISHEGGVTNLIVGSNLSELGGCFDLSNEISVVRNTVEGVGVSSLLFDMEACDARILGDYEQDYSEFIAEASNQTDCAQFEVQGVSLGRVNPSENPHSCTEGINGTKAICVSSLDDCSYIDDSDYSLRVTIEITPGMSGAAVLSSMSFYSRAPEQYTFVNGDVGLNNYPTLYGFRVIKNGQEVYKSEDRATSRDYNFEEFDFSTIDDFKVSQTSSFDFEFLGYCLIGNGGEETAWDMDNLRFNSECNNKIDAGVVTLANGATSIQLCTDDGIQDDIQFFTNSLFTPYQYVITAADNRIVALANGDSFNFEGGLAGNCRVLGVAYTGTFNGNIGDTVGEDAMSSGCWMVSDNFINIQRLNGGDCPGSKPSAGPSKLTAKLSPNPVVDYVNIEFREFGETMSDIKIYNMDGVLMESQSHNANESNNISLDISAFPQGSYFMKITNGWQKKIYRFIKLDGE